jgi:chemotaxis response regulator CheB
MTISEALFTHIAALADVVSYVSTRVYAVEAPRPAASVTYEDVVVIAFEGATEDGLSTPRNRTAEFTIAIVSLSHLRAAQLAESICRSMHGINGTMGGTGGVAVVDCVASEGPEDFDSEHLLYARSVALRLTYEF